MKTHAIVLVLSAAVLPVEAFAQCGYVNFCSGSQHQFAESPDNNCYPHPGCEGPCGGGACHPVCGNCDPMFASNPVLQQRLSALHAAASAGDLDEVLRLAPSVPGYLAFNASRQSVQIRICSGGSILANLPLRNAHQRQIAQLLPSPALMLAEAPATDVRHFFRVAASKSAATEVAAAYLMRRGAGGGDQMSHHFLYYAGPVSRRSDGAR